MPRKQQIRPSGRTPHLIFTRRFGALAARPNFREIDEKVQESNVDVLSAEAELEAMTAEVESAEVYAGSK